MGRDQLHDVGSRVEAAVSHDSRWTDQDVFGLSVPVLLHPSRPEFSALHNPGDPQPDEGDPDDEQQQQDADAYRPHAQHHDLPGGLVSRIGSRRHAEQDIAVLFASIVV